MKNQANLTRRQLCRQAVYAVPAGAALWAALGALEGVAKASPATLKFAPDTDPMLKTLKYTADAARAVREKRGGIEGKDQFCNNCQFFAKQGDIGGKPAGKCIMIQSGLVADRGWCASWAKKS